MQDHCYHPSEASSAAHKADRQQESNTRSWNEPFNPSRCILSNSYLQFRCTGFTYGRGHDNDSSGGLYSVQYSRSLWHFLEFMHAPFPERRADGRLSRGKTTHPGGELKVSLSFSNLNFFSFFFVQSFFSSPSVHAVGLSGFSIGSDLHFGRITQSSTLVLRTELRNTSDQRTIAREIIPPK